MVTQRLSRQRLFGGSPLRLSPITVIEYRPTNHPLRRKAAGGRLISIMVMNFGPWLASRQEEHCILITEF
jgi:hypothetical protein